MDAETLNKALVGRWFASFWGDCCDLDIVDELAAPDVLLHYSMQNPRRGRLSVKSFMADLRSLTGPAISEVGALIADRDIVVIRWEGSRTHTGPSFEDFNVGPLPALHIAPPTVGRHSEPALSVLDRPCADTFPPAS